MQIIIQNLTNFLSSIERVFFQMHDFVLSEIVHKLLNSKYDVVDILTIFKFESDTSKNLEKSNKKMHSDENLSGNRAIV